jgi:hypothetical protein
MRWTIPFGVIAALAFLIPAAPAAPAAAQTGKPGLDEFCQPIEREQYTDLRTLIDIDLDKATDIEVRLRANQILSAARTDSLPTLPGATQTALDGSADGLRAFLKTEMAKVWSEDLLALVKRTLANAGAHVKAAAEKVLAEKTIDASLAYLNNGLYVARELDCQATAPPTSTSPTPSGPVLPVTGTNPLALVIGGATLVALGLGAVLLGRRART